MHPHGLAAILPSSIRMKRKPAPPEAIWQIQKVIHMSRLIAVYRDSILEQIGSNREHGWGQDDSLNVIETVIAEDASEFAGGCRTLLAAQMSGSVDPLELCHEQYARYTLSDTAKSLIKSMINPSAARNQLEKMKFPVGHKLAGQTLLAPTEKKRGSGSSPMAGAFA